MPRLPQNPETMYSGSAYRFLMPSIMCRETVGIIHSDVLIRVVDLVNR
jgi:hypothetical protein